MRETWEELWNREWPHRGRDGVISCSQLDRLFACPGNRVAASNLPDDCETRDEATMGTVLHYCLLEAGDIPLDAPQEAEDLFWWCKSIYEKLPGTLFSNERYFETDILTGSADNIKTSSNGHSELFINDLKTGRIPVFIDSKQLLGYAWLASKEIKPTPKRYTVGIIQPLVYGSNVPTMTYEQKDLERFEEELRENLKSTRLGVSKHCKYCKAKLTQYCSETRDIFGVFCV